jgi:hypothetical protein
MAKLIKAVFVRDPERHRTVLLKPGEEPEPRLAALVTNPDAWEDGKPPAEANESKADGDAGTDSDKGSSDSADKEAAPTAKKTAARKTAASNRSRGRDAAGEGTSGE